jgi:uncharacterized membrane protein
MNTRSHPAPRVRSSGRVLAALAALLIVKVTAGVVAGYSRYIPPDFRAGFLRGREGHFEGAYRAAFYAHIASGPVALLLGLTLVGERLRGRSPRWHRRLGRVQAACVLGLVAPSGLVMAPFAAAGPVGAAGLATLAVATAASVALGARAAIRGRLDAHRRWMWRCYLLLCSAVVIRLMGGLATVVGLAAAWFDPLASWLCWLGPLAAFEIRERWGRTPGASPPDRPITTPAGAGRRRRSSRARGPRGRRGWSW